MTMPERVQAYITPDGDVVLVQPNGDHRGIVLVPESRLLAAEARAKAMEDGPLDYMSGKCDRLKEENATLRAEREALVPLARLGLWAYDEHQSGGGLWDDEFRDKSFMLGIHVGFGRESEATTQARAILAREET